MSDMTNPFGAFCYKNFGGHETSSGEDEPSNPRVNPQNIRMNAKPAPVPKDGWMSTRSNLTAKERKENISKAKAARNLGQGHGNVSSKRALPTKKITNGKNLNPKGTKGVYGKRKHFGIDQVNTDDENFIASSNSDEYIETPVKPKNPRLKTLAKKHAAFRIQDSSEEEEFQSDGESDDSNSSELDLQSDENGGGLSADELPKPTHHSKGSNILSSAEKPTGSSKFRRRMINDIDSCNESQSNLLDLSVSSDSKHKKMKVDSNEKDNTKIFSSLSRKKAEVYGSASEVDSMESDDDGTKARLSALSVLDECKGLSDKLTAVISSWTSKTDTQDGALCLNDCNVEVKQGEIFTHREVKEACWSGLELSPYQLAGVNWMEVLRRVRVNGVLADEMGLGKTVQTIAFLGMIRLRNIEGGGTGKAGRGPGTGPHLIVVPSSVLSNWEKELKRFCPALDVAIYHGSQAERMDMRTGELGKASKGQGKWMPHILLTTYSLWERTSAVDDRTFLKRFRYEYMILDEGHSIKNASSSRFKALSKVNSRHRLLLSGTPVQNNLRELLSLLMFLMPNVFKSDAVTVLVEMLEEGMKESRQFESGASTNVKGTTMTPTDVRNMLAPFVLRRLKAAVLEQLVPKTTVHDILPLETIQRSLYEGILQAHLKRKAGNTLQEESIIDIDVKSLVGSSTEANNVFTALRKAANHPLLLLNHFKDEKMFEKVVNVTYKNNHFGPDATIAMVKKELMTYSDYDMHQLCTTYSGSLGALCLEQDDLFSSAKMVRLKELLPQLQREGHRVLLFSQWTRILDLLEVFLSDVLNLRFVRLDGSTPVNTRQGIIDEFTKDEEIMVFLLSTRAGGLGINLTCADTVIMHDLDFNPENDKQAEDRCHRIGQTKPVRVIKLVAQNTVDEDIFRLGVDKSAVSAAVLGESTSDSGRTKKEETSTIASILNRAIKGHLQQTVSNAKRKKL